MKYKKTSIAVNLSLRFMIVLASATILLCFLFFAVLDWFNKSQRNSALVSYTEKACDSIMQSEGFEPVINLPYFISYVVFDLETKKVLSTNDPFLPCLKLNSGRPKLYFQKNYYTDSDLRILYYSKLIKNEKGSVVVQLSMDLERGMKSRLQTVLPKTLILILIPLLVVSFLICYLITLKTIRPVVKMTEAAQKISIENLEERLPVGKKNNELDRLAFTFNNLFSRLKSDFDRERNFTSDVSHELKTPVAVILGEAKLLKRWGKDDPAQLEESLNTIIEEGNSMNEIIKNLLQMSKLENGQIPINKTPVDVGKLFVRIKNEFNVVNPDVEFSITDEKCIVESDEELLHQLFAILVQNSIKFAGDKCKIQLKSRAFGEKTLMCVQDNGKGFAENVLPHVFERFYRGDTAHTRTAGGAGLGLSIGKVIAESLNGTISAKNADEGGALIEILI